MDCSVVEVLRQLVAIPSPNPMGRANPGGEFGERRLTAFLTSWFGHLGIAHKRQSVHPERENVIARLDGRGAVAETILLLEAHQDTVPADGMTIPPWEPNIDGDRLYGRGACDVKGGMAAILAVVARLAADPLKDHPTLLVACTVDEEYGASGAVALADLVASASHPFAPTLPSAAIVAEPTGLQTVVAHKGVVRWLLDTQGRAAHSSTPDAGENAIYRMAAVLNALERYQREVLPGLGTHRLCGRSTLSVGTIHGGLSVNTVPDRCSIEVDRRLMPGESPERAGQHLTAYLDDALGPQAYSLQRPYLSIPTLVDGENQHLAEQLGESVRSLAREQRQIGVAYATDAPHFARLGIPTVVFGPGSVRQAHTNDEWISITELETAAEILYRFVSDFAP